MKRGNTKGLAESLRASRQQVINSSSYKKQIEQNKRKSNYSSDKSYSLFIRKYENLTPEVISSFGTKDLVYYFRQKANEANLRYYISSYSRDCSVMKKLLKEYSQMEICLMIEFLFSPEQEYLDKGTLAPTILISSWNNTIYQDSVKWANDEYIPHNKRKKKSSKPVREWDNKNTDIKIGEWN